MVKRMSKRWQIWASRGSYEQRWSRNWEVLQVQKSNNTQYKTKSDLNAWKKFCESLKESRAIENIPANELDFFFISVRKQYGTEYEPRTLSGFQQSFQCHLKTKSVLLLQHRKMSSQSNNSSVRQFLPEHILTSLKAAHSMSTFSVVISRKSQGWVRTDRWAIEPQTGVKICCTFGHFLEIFHWTYMKRMVILSAFIDRVCTKPHFYQLFLSRLDWRLVTGLVTEVSQLNAWARAREQLK